MEKLNYKEIQVDKQTFEKFLQINKNNIEKKQDMEYIVYYNKKNIVARIYIDYGEEYYYIREDLLK